MAAAVVVVVVVVQQGTATVEITRDVTTTAAAVDALAARNTDVLQHAELSGQHAGEMAETAKALDTSRDRRRSWCLD
jgi:hypothetical protein